MNIIMDINKAMKTDRLFRGLTWMTVNEFNLLLPTFEKILIENALKQKDRKRSYGWWRKGNIRDAKQKLFFILVYLKTYPTVDVWAYMFNSSRSRISWWVLTILPVLEKALWRSLVLPARRISTPEEFFKLFPWTKEIMIDWVERPTIRKKKPKNQTKNYSGKKKWPRRKNTIIADKTKKILYLSPTKYWKLHDKKQIDKTNVIHNIPREINILADTWYTWLQKEHHNVLMPKKKSKKHPLTEDEKWMNRLISSARVVVENAICWMKRYKAASDIFRWKKWQDDRYMAVTAWLWNFHLLNS